MDDAAEDPNAAVPEKKPDEPAGLILKIIIVIIIIIIIIITIIIIIIVIIIVIIIIVIIIVIVMITIIRSLHIIAHYHYRNLPYLC